MRYLSSFIIALICTSGFMIQVGHVTSRHFEYQTRTIVSLVIPNEVEIPSVSVCVRVNEMLNLDQVRTVFNRSGLKYWYDGIWWDAYYRDTSDWTMANWFNFTPAANDILRNEHEGCRIRRPNVFAVDSLPRAECVADSNIVKYFDREFVCYRYEPMYSNQTLKLIQYTMTPGSTGIIYELLFNKTLFHFYEYVSVAVHSSDSSYLYDTVFSSSHKVAVAQDREYKFDTHYQEVERVRMKHPYDTKCVDIPADFKTGAEYVLNTVNRESMDKLNRVIPFLPTYNESLNKNMYSNPDFQNRTIIESLNQMMDSKTAPNECVTKYFITKSTPSFSDTLTVAVYWPQDETITFKYIPQSEIIDYVIYIGSCVGMWFGLSALSIVDGVSFISKSLKYRMTEMNGEEERVGKEHLKKLENDIKMLKHQMAFIKRFSR